MQPPTEPLVLVLDHATSWDGATLWITATTDRLCSLTMRYQQTGIVLHERITIVRGVPFTRDPHQAFDNYQTQLQIETGETLIHTFAIDGWYPCKSWHWMFVAMIGGSWSPSYSPVFTWHKEPGPWSEIIRPAAPGTYTQFPHERPLSAPHWQTVDNFLQTPDDWCGKLYGSYITEPKTDTYRFTPLHTPPHPIIELVTRSWWWGSGVGVDHQNWHAIITYGTLYLSPMQEHRNPGWFGRAYTWATNPHTGKPWTVDEVKAAQYGQKLWVEDGGGAMEMHQLYAIIEFEPSSVPLIGV